MSDEKEYVTFTVETMSGDTVEMAVLYEFEYEKKMYVAARQLQGTHLHVPEACKGRRRKNI